MVVRNHVEIISKEMVKPSSPTPHHLKNFKLSLLDQLAPPAYVTILFFYDQPEFAHDIDCNQASQLLKQSLSSTLTMFYPLAGRMENDFSINCNDAGVEYVEARVHAEFSRAIEEPDAEALRQYLPTEFYGSPAGMTEETVPLAVQMNLFDGGGMAIGVSISHNVADAASLATFINAWAAISRGDTEVERPRFDLACHFPPRDDLLGLRPREMVTREKIATRRFLFDKEMIAALKEAESSRSEVKNPSRVEAVSAFIWRHVLEAKTKESKKKMRGALQAVNLRKRMCPPLVDHVFGNGWTMGLTFLEKGHDDGDLCGQLRSAIRSIDGDYVKSIQVGGGDGAVLDKLKRAMDHISQGEFCNFSSWNGFPVYEVDYGWGRPVWVCTTTLPVKNMVMLMGSRCGEAIEAWVTTPEEDMASLHHHHHNLLLLGPQKTLRN